MLARTALAALALPAALAAQSHFYVDVATGVDVPSGGGAGAPWKTITYAISQLDPDPLQGPPATIHVAPGAYAPSTGEVFPLQFKGMLRVRSDAGFAYTVLDGEGAGVALVNMSSTVGGYTGPLQPETELVGFTLRNAHSGIALASSWNPVLPTLADLVIEQMTDAGVAGLTCCESAGTLKPLLVRVAIDACGVGIDWKLDGPSGSGLALQDSFIANCASDGLRSSGSSIAEAMLSRTRITGNGGDAIHGAHSGNGGLELSAEHCLINDNAGDGYDGGAQCGPTVSAQATFVRCTIANNAGVGVRSLPSATVAPNCIVVDTTTLASCIVYGNGDDLLPHPNFASLVIAHSDVGDGDLPSGGGGNFSADPLFAAPAAGDYRLSFGSPCAERGDPGMPAGVIDLAGTAGAIDGDFDAVELIDMGALELATMVAPGDPHIGQPFVLELWGPAGAPAIVYVAPGKLLTAPIPTPFGEIDISPVGAFSVGAYTAYPGPPGALTLHVPNDPTLIGARVSFQCAVLNGHAAPPVATSNGVASAIKS